MVAGVEEKGAAVKVVETAAVEMAEEKAEAAKEEVKAGVATAGGWVEVAMVVAREAVAREAGTGVEGMVGAMAEEGKVAGGWAVWRCCCFIAGCCCAHAQRA